MIFESKDFDMVAYSTTCRDAKRILNVNKTNNVFYIFECYIRKQYPYTMKLRAPLDKFYDCKKINKYKEEHFEENDKYIIISYETDYSICFDVTHN